MTTAKFDIYEHVSAEIVRLMETEGTNWTKPWRSTAHQNVASRKPYNGVNVALTFASASRKGYTSTLWGTYKQWAERGYQVQKGEKATPITFWKMFERDTGKVNGKGEAIVDRIPTLRHFSVFNGDQVRDASGNTYNVPADPAANGMTEAARIAAADAVIAATGAKIIHAAGDRAFYSSATDQITIPPFGAFTSRAGYYGTAFHELGHWTGHASRLDRLKLAPFGSPEYAFEELIAESAAAFLAADLGIETAPAPDHAKYLNGWIARLREDKRAIFRAFSAARKAAAFINPKPEAEAEEPAAVAA